MGVTKMKPIKLTRRSEVNPKAGNIRGLWKKNRSATKPKRKQQADLKFREWYAENRESEALHDSWENAVLDCRMTGEKPPTFRQFAREVFNQGD